MFLAIAENMQLIEKVSKNEKELIEQFTRNLPYLLKGFKVRGIKAQPKGINNYDWDLTAEIIAGKIRKKLVFEIKTIGEPKSAMVSIPILESATKSVKNSYPVFVSGYISERTRKLLKERDIGYMDLTGNIFLKFDDVWMDRSAPESFKRERRALKQIIAPKATRVLRTLLTRPNEEMKITDLARLCSMSPGGIYWVVRLLEEKGYVERDSNKRVILIRPDELLDDWAKSWDIRKNSWTTYFSFEKNPEALMRKIAEFGNNRKLDYAFTLMAGSSLVAPFVRFQDVWMYSDSDEKEWIEGLDLRPVTTGGNLMIIKPYDGGVFMDAQSIKDINVVSNIQLYVDLYNYAARGREQAEFLKERMIKFKER